jgi:hypothetical protein
MGFLKQIRSPPYGIQSPEYLAPWKTESRGADLEQTSPISSDDEQHRLRRPRTNGRAKGATRDLERSLDQMSEVRCIDEDEGLPMGACMYLTRELTTRSVRLYFDRLFTQSAVPV